MLALIASLLLADCAALPGTDALLARPERVIVIGEDHGTNEQPAAFTAIVCEAAMAGPVTVALEYSDAAQGALDAYLAAPDDAMALAVLTNSGLFSQTVDDGRGSEAMLALLASVRALKVQGRDIALHAFQPSQPRPPGQRQAWYELDMGHALARPVTTQPNTRVIALVGSFHARKTPWSASDDAGLPAAGHLPAAETLTLQFAAQGGEVWNCQQIGAGPADCGVHGGPGRADVSLRGVYLEPTPDGAYGGLLAVGPTTASPPARLGETDQAAVPNPTQPSAAPTSAGSIS